jgi:hypothetical protein
MPQLSPVYVLTSFGCRIDSQFFQPTNSSDSAALEAASLSSALKESQQALLQAQEENRLAQEEIRQLRLQIAGHFALNDQDFMDV